MLWLVAAASIVAAAGFLSSLARAASALARQDAELVDQWERDWVDVHQETLVVYSEVILYREPALAADDDGDDSPR